jgi:hypothetical protein
MLVGIHRLHHQIILLAGAVVQEVLERRVLEQPGAMEELVQLTRLEQA